MRRKVSLGVLCLLALSGPACDESARPRGERAGQLDASGLDLASGGDAPLSGERGLFDARRGETSTTPASCKAPKPAWLLCEDFEGMAAGMDAWLKGSGWTDNIGATDPGRMTVSTQAHSGKYAVQYPASAGSGYQGADLIWRACAGTNKPGCTPLKGYPQLYLRTWIRFAPDHQKVHHFLSVGGGLLTDYWVTFGNAGCRPTGKTEMGTTVDFADSTHETYFYTYYPEMTCDSGTNCAKYADPSQICADCASKGMPCSNGLECCWGNLFKPATPAPLPLGKWFCFEMMMRANDVGQKNGEMAYWIDGKLANQVKGMHFRNTNDVQMNQVRLQHYLTTGDAAGHSNQVWFDDVVISTEPVGCL